MAMTYTQQGDRVTIEMSRDDFERLTIMLGYALGAAVRVGNHAQFYSWLAFVNHLNATNPNFTPYEIPGEYAEHAGKAGL